MKFAFSILTVTLLTLCASAQTTFTNGTKISALVNATTPLTGSEVVPVNQGGVTKTTTVAQINNAPLAANTISSNALQTQVLANATTAAAANLATSNALQTQVTANLNAATATSNALQSLITANTSRDVTSSNALQSQISSNAVAAAAANLATSNAIIGIANAAAAQAVATGVTNGGAANFGYVSYAVAHLGTITNSGSIVVSASLATVQNLYVQASGSGNKTLNLSLTNLSAGQSFSVVINRTDPYGTMTYNVVLPSGAINLNSGGATTVALAPQKSLLLNFNTIGATVSQTIMSASVSQ